MKLPKLPTWLWILLGLYTAGGAALKFGWWKPKGEGSGLFWGPVFAPVLLLLRWLPSPKSPGAALPILVGPSGMSDPTTYRPQNMRDKYNTYVATTTSNPPLSFDAWMQLQTGEADTSGAALTNVN